MSASQCDAQISSRFPPGPPMLKMYDFSFFPIVGRTQSALREAKTACLAIKRSALDDIKSARNAFWRLRV